MPISLAIPTYNSSLYLWDCIKPAIHNDFIGEIVICDDGSSINEYGNICEIVAKINSDKIKIYRNTINQKAFINKYNTIKNCSYDWVYLLDSDNWFDESIIEIISKLDYSKLDTCYIQNTLLVTDGNVVTFDYDDRIIDLNLAKEYIKQKVHHFDWFLNAGNFIVNRQTYLDSQKIFFEQNLYHGSIDVVLFSYYWFMSNNKYEIVDGMQHHHRIQPNSYFMQNADENLVLVDDFFNKILNL